MTTARKRLVAVETTPYYHLIGRCVRRGFLCGRDAVSGRNYEHRRQWIVDRIGKLTELFAIDVLAYAIMSNHYHIVVRIRPEQTRDWSNDEVIQRWAALFGVPSLLSKWRNGDCNDAEHTLATALLERRRERLGSLSWFMKCLNEHIARRANREDQCTGAFWEGRFKSQALLDERALLSCMAYVDLNPMRAAVARTPQQSDYTSIQARMKRTRPIRLAPFCDEVAAQQCDEAIPFDYRDYLTLVQWTGRAQVGETHQALDTQAPAILGQMGLDQDTWFKSLQLYRKPFLVIGSPDRIREAARQLSRKWFRGLGEMAFLAKS